jgi:hypothetical protein
LKEQAERLGVPCGIVPLLPVTSADLEQLEREIQATARALSAATGIMASSLETLIDQVEHYGVCVQTLRRWQY